MESTTEILRPRITWKTWDKVMSDRATQYEELLVQREMGQEPDLFIPTGLKRWDANGGITRSVLTVLGGVDGQGKSFVKKHLAMNAARSGRKVVIIDFEDPEEKTADREFSSITGIDSRHLALLKFDSDALGDIFKAAASVREYGQNIRYHGGLVDAAEIMRALNACAAEGWIPDLVLVDYAQALPETENSNLERTIAKLAWDANVFAQQTRCGFVVFSQVKPEVSNRGHSTFFAAKKRDPDSWDVSGFCPGPGTQDLAWSSAFGQRGRAVGYIFRPGHYECQLGKPGASDNRLIIRWAKVTFGNSGVLELAFDGPTGRIFDKD
jgi:replicative DNA helicase